MIDLTEIQKENIKWFKENLKGILKKPAYKDKHLVIHNKEIVNAFEHAHHAIDFVIKKFKSFDECVIQEAIDEKEVINFINVQVKSI